MTTREFGRSVGSAMGILPLIAVAWLLMGATAAQAQAATQGNSGWHYNLLVYGWGAGMSGDVGPSIKQYEAHVTASDLLNLLQFAGMLHFEARDGNWGILVEPLYVNLGKTVDNQGRRRMRTIDFNLEMGVIGLGGSYRIQESPKSSFDFTFGARYTALSTDITPKYVRSFHKSFSWTDPVIGLRGGVKMSRAWTFIYRADIGGFGVGSDLTWSGAVNFDALVSKTVSINFGYIALYDKYKSGSGPTQFNYDVTMMGPFLGVGFKW